MQDPWGKKQTPLTPDASPPHPHMVEHVFAAMDHLLPADLDESSWTFVHELNCFIIIW